jgi:hypothetical protein
VLAFSIPIVDRPEDASSEVHKFGEKLNLTQEIGWHFYVKSGDPNFEYVYNKTWADATYAKAIRYHTSMDRDAETQRVGVL